MTAVREPHFLITDDFRVQAADCEYEHCACGWIADELGYPWPNWVGRSMEQSQEDILTWLVGEGYVSDSEVQGVKDLIDRNDGLSHNVDRVENLMIFVKGSTHLTWEARDGSPTD